MEVISEYDVNPVGIALLVFGILLILAGIFAILIDNASIIPSLLVFGTLGVGCVIASIVAFNSESANHHRLRIRIDETISVSELKEKYEIVKYDKDTDLWIVEEKSDEGEK